MVTSTNLRLHAIYPPQLPGLVTHEVLANKCSLMNARHMLRDTKHFETTRTQNHEVGDTNKVLARIQITLLTHAQLHQQLRTTTYGEEPTRSLTSREL